MTEKLDFPKIAAALVCGTPLKFRSTPDGGLIVIAPSGQKLIYTVEQVEAKARELAAEIKDPPKPKASVQKPVKKTAQKPKNTSNPPAQ